MNSPIHYLIVDDDRSFSDILARSLKRRGLTVDTANSRDDALSLCRQQRPQRVILDLKLGETSGLNLIEDIQRLAPDASILILTGYSSIPTAVEAIKLGACNYLCKPAAATEIVNAFTESLSKPAPDLPLTPPSVERLEWEHIQRVLADCQGNISATARTLGMHRRTLQRKLQKRPVKQ